VPDRNAAPLFLDAAAVEAALPFPELIAALREAFRAGGVTPVRHHHEVDVPGGAANTLLIMPAWQPGAATGVKLVQVCPGNGARGLPSVPGLYLLFDGPTGMPRAVLDGASLTVRRTAAASALAADYLARPEARRLAMLGAGALAPNLIAAHCAVRPIEQVTVWNRTPERAEALVARLLAQGVNARLSSDPEAAVRGADIVSCATMSREPVVRGAWLEPGTHVDLVGAFNPAMRESDDEVMRRGALFVDTRAGTMSEAGDLLQAIASGALREEAILAELAELCSGRHPGRCRGDEITVFKSCGAALEDLAAARLVVEGAGGTG
jgi:alanine dehydrogenase